MPKRGEAGRRAERWPAESAIRGRAGIIAASLALIALWQMTLVWDRLPVPFLDTRLHYYWDNAFLSFNARSGNRSGDLRSQFGATSAAYVRWGEPARSPTYYTDHPFLMKALFQQTARVTGTDEWASRGFYLLVSFGIAAGLLFVVLQATGNLFAAFAAGLVLVSLPLFSTFQITAKYELDGMLLGVWQIAALGAYLRRPTPAARAAHFSLTGLAVLAHWTAVLSAGATGGYLMARFWRRRDEPSRRALLSTVAGGITGLALLIGLMAFMQGGLSEAWTPLARSFARRSEAVPFGEWAARQWLFIGANFGRSFLLSVLGICVFLVGRWTFLRRAGGSGETKQEGDGWLLSLFVAATAFTGCAWVLMFRQGSFIHVYWQLWLALPGAALVAAFIASLRGRRRLQMAAGIGSLLLCLHLRSLSSESYEEILGVQLGTPQDTEFLKSLREERFSRMVFIPLTEDPLNDWFQGPLFDYYTDRPVALLQPEAPPKTGEKLLVLRFEGQGMALRELEARFEKLFANERCGPRFCAYDVRDP